MACGLRCAFRCRLRRTGHSALPVEPRESLTSLQGVRRLVRADGDCVGPSRPDVLDRQKPFPETARRGRSSSTVLQIYDDASSDLIEGTADWAGSMPGRSRRSAGRQAGGRGSQRKRRYARSGHRYAIRPLAGLHRLATVFATPVAHFNPSTAEAPSEHDNQRRRASSRKSCARPGEVRRRRRALFTDRSCRGPVCALSCARASVSTFGRKGPGSFRHAHSGLYLTELRWLI